MPVNNEAVVEFKAAVKHYRAPEGNLVRALDGIDLRVAANEFVTLLGPSGCGKTTLLRAISGFERLDSGELYIQGQAMNQVPAHRRPVHTVFQNYALFAHRSVGDNVGYALEVKGVAKAERLKRAAQALELVGLEHMQKRLPAQLSGGQQQRVALARALVDRPALLLLDEPLSALDRQLRQNMQRELKRLQQELGIAFVFVTHDQEEALTMSDRIVVLNGGKVQQIGSPLEIYHQPSNAFVAGFIGESILLNARVNARDANTCTLALENGSLLTLAHPTLVLGQALHLMLRPEQLHLTPPSPQAVALNGQLEQLVFIGKDFELCVRLPNNQHIKALVRGSAPTQRAGQAISLWFEPSSAHVLGASA